MRYAGTARSLSGEGAYALLLVGQVSISVANLNSPVDFDNCNPSIYLRNLLLISI